jgi:hypothetical protein
MKSYKISENKKELKEATIEFPKYHLKIRTEDRKIEKYKVTDCCTDRFEFENYNYEHIKMLFSM